ncbi:PCYCGC motif-containing (lipo)protein [Halobacillus sp. Marseille-Q1614]|uniref:PCYCGC motif-containing (lipo)protein n=1 Tax=Halobacillus sp. Marseille-Q1614 TaxID=2709134 RepID=UPI00156DFA82|nr:PCYCGC motif-containing (lipo)protein [Halobacillus sp. Marseille-Q1614]
MKTNLIIIFGLLLSTLLIGCSQNSEDSSGGASEEHEGHAQETAGGDIREETSGSDVMPAFLEEKPEEMQNIYMAVSQHKELLEQIPCYCGCGDSVGHRDNYDCFVHKNGEDGSLVWDDHGTKCGVCLEIAAQSIVDYQDGKSVKEIREDIDKQYEQGYSKPTPTPEV